MTPELASSQSFVIDLCELLGVSRPHATGEQDCICERPVAFLTVMAAAALGTSI